MKLNEFRTPEYSAPSCKTINLSIAQPVLGGSFGEPGQPGGNADNNPIDPEFED